MKHIDDKLPFWEFFINLPWAAAQALGAAAGPAEGAVEASCLQRAPYSHPTSDSLVHRLEKKTIKVLKIMGKGLGNLEHNNSDDVTESLRRVVVGEQLLFAPSSSALIKMLSGSPVLLHGVQENRAQYPLLNGTMVVQI